MHACSSDQNTLMFRHSSLTRLMNDSTHTLRQGCPSEVQRSPAQSAIAAQASRGLPRSAARSGLDAWPRKASSARLVAPAGGSYCSAWAPTGAHPAHVLVPACAGRSSRLWRGCPVGRRVRSCVRQVRPDSTRSPRAHRQSRDGVDASRTRRVPFRICPVTLAAEDVVRTEMQQGGPAVGAALSKALHGARVHFKRAVFLTFADFEVVECRTGEHDGRLEPCESVSTASWSVCPSRRGRERLPHRDPAAAPRGPTPTGLLRP